MANIEEKRILIIGGTGSLGQALVQRLIDKNEIFLFSRDEAKHWTLRNQWGANGRLNFIVGDVRDKSRIKGVLLHLKPEIIILAAALKQVDTGELSPTESINTNILGTENLIETILDSQLIQENLDCVLFVSTDKACAPTNVYGMCKAISERLVSSASLRSEKVRFISVRYGNVLESRGSIIPLFRFQVEKKTFITLTSAGMTRFIMTLDESIDLIQRAILGADSGEIWIPQLKSMKILHLAEIFASRYNKKIEITGMRPGEKIHEELISEPESFRVKRGELDFVLQQSFLLNSNNVESFSYSSKDNALSKEKLEERLDSLGMFSRDLSLFQGKQIEEIRTN